MQAIAPKAGAPRGAEFIRSAPAFASGGGGAVSTRLRPFGAHCSINAALQLLDIWAFCVFAEKTGFTLADSLAR